MNRLYLDTDIISDVTGKREPFLQASSSIITLGLNGECLLGACAMSFPFSYYTGYQNTKDSSKTRRSVRVLLDQVEVVDMTLQLLLGAMSVDIEDYEDAVQYQSALEFRADYLITRDKKDFPMSIIPVLTPTDYLDLRARGQLVSANR